MEWNTSEGTSTWETVQVDMLMDIREELRMIRRTVCCVNATAMPSYLRRIAANTAKRKRKARK